MEEESLVFSSEEEAKRFFELLAACTDTARYTVSSFREEASDQIFVSMAKVPLDSSEQIPEQVMEFMKLLGTAMSAFGVYNEEQREETALAVPITILETKHWVIMKSRFKLTDLSWDLAATLYKTLETKTTN